MEIKRIDPKLYKAIIMAYQYQINCELTSNQCKELVYYIDSSSQVEDECVWKEEKRRIGKPDEYFLYKSPHEPSHFHGVIGNYDERKIFIYCHVCGKHIKYVEEE